MAEKYFDTQALLGVVIRDPTILGADITGYSVTVNANYDWPESGKPFVPGYSLSMNPDTGLSVYQASSPNSGGLVLEMLMADHQYVPWYFDRMELYTGSFSAVYLTRTRFLDGQVEFRENTDFSTLSNFPDTQQYVQKGVQPVGELIITDRQTYDPYTDSYPNAPASVGVSSRASFNYNPQNITKVSQMVMRSSNQGDTQFATKDTILEIDKAGAAITPKIGPGAEADSIKIVSGALAAGNTRGAIEISSNGSVSGINDVTITGRLVVPDGYTRSNSNGRLLAVTSGGGVGYTQTPAMTRAWATSTVAATLASTTHGYQVGSTTGANIAMGPSQIMGRNNGAAMRISVPGGFTDIPDPVTGTDSTSKAWVEAYVAANTSSGTFTELGSGIDLDTITTVGRYWQSENADAAAGTNYPTPLAGYLEVVSNASQAELLQYYTTYNVSQATGGMYVRNRYNGTWGAWQVIFYDSGWVDCTLASGWTHNTAAGQAPGVQCRKINNQIVFRGRASGTLTVAATTTIVNIPVGYRPSIDTNFNPIGSTAGFIGWANATVAGTIAVHFKTPYATGSTVLDFSAMTYTVN